MIDINDLPHTEIGEYKLFFYNVTGAASMLHIMRKDKKDIIPRHSVLMVAFIDDPMARDEPRFQWHNNVNELPKKPFDEEWAKAEWKRLRLIEFGKITG